MINIDNFRLTVEEEIFDLIASWQDIGIKGLILDRAVYAKYLEDTKRTHIEGPYRKVKLYGED